MPLIIISTFGLAMKLKEYPQSLFYSAKLKLRSAQKLDTAGVDVPENIVVTFTSIPSRLHVLNITVRSLLNQTVKPNKIVLWLNHDLAHNLPASLTKLESERFTIQFRDGTSSHRKLVFALQEYKDSILVTCDDDLIYPPDWLERLIKSHRKYPNHIIGHECRNIAYRSNGEVAPYSLWHSAKPSESTNQTVAIGYGGTLYPPNTLNPMVTDESLYMALTPKADDLWFKAMAMLNNTTVSRSTDPHPKPIPIINSQKIALGHTNIKQDGNRSQWQALVNHFNLDTKR